MGRTIQVDDEAFHRLEQARRAAESHSEVIRRCIPLRRSVEEILGIFRRSRLSKKTLAAIDESVAQRRSTPRRRGG